MKNIGILILTLSLPLILFSKDIIIEGELIWDSNISSKFVGENNKEFLSFKNAKYDSEKDYLPILSKKILLGNEEVVNVKVLDVVYEDVTDVLNIAGKDYIKEDIDLNFSNSISRKKNFGFITFTPIIYNKLLGKFQRVVSYKIRATTKSSIVINKNQKNSFVINSVLESGEWFKIGVLRDGVFKLTYQFLKDLGIDVDNINPQDLKLYGNGGKMLPELNSMFRHDDIQQNAIVVEGENDGVFNNDDYILFYGTSPHSISAISATTFGIEKNKYSDTTYYFITASQTGEPSKRVVSQASSVSSNQTVTSFNSFDYLEEDNINLLKSGQIWLGNSFDATTDFDYVFNFPNSVSSTPLTVNVSGAGRSQGSLNLVSSKFTVNSGGTSFNVDFKGVDINSYTGKYADYNSASSSFNNSGDLFSMNISYNKPFSTSIAWLDKIEVNGRRNLVMTNNQLKFSDLNSVGVGNISKFVLSSAVGVMSVWDVSDILNVKEQLSTLSGSTLEFNIPTDSLKTFIALTNDFETQVFALGIIENQNLHGIPQKDMVIVCYPDFLNQAQQVANFHENEGLSVVVVTPQQIYNEFSSGSQDLVAIRDFLRMFYERSTSQLDLPKYLLLFGDGSYDMKNRLTGNTNLIPTYQSENSITVIGSYVSDDYFGLLDPNEGVWSSAESIDVAIGRLPVKSTDEANNVVNKIINYNTPSSMKDWRNVVCFVGDDGDGITHMSQANSLAGIVETNYQDNNVDKIFIDAFQQVSTPGGSRYPEVNSALNTRVNDGALIVNYTGHGGEVGWAHERILEISDINSWDNFNSLPLFVTATCEFSRFDDPSRTSAGELILLNEKGGLGLLTTVRIVYSGPNLALNTSFYNHVFERVDGEMPRLGDVFVEVKNENGGDKNTRNFTLLGDPALRLNYPKHDVITSTINGVNISSVDTIKALSKVVVTGSVQDTSGQVITGFNGIVYPTVFDKRKEISTLNNDNVTNGVFKFNLQTSKLFKGKVAVVDGLFSFEFVVPKDISYNYGKGKLSYYADNQVEDANGFSTDFFIGGTADNYEADDKGPNIELYMNDDNFVFGGITDENPSLLAYVNDLHGINMVGNGIGHDITAVLDGKTDEAFVLNDYYEADLNSYQKGVIKFPFQELEEGVHTLKLKVWDVYNNSSEVSTEFNVVGSKDVVLDRVYNYPNPFTTYTEFWFEHNQPNKQMYAQVQVYTVSGKLVKTLEQHILSEGYRSTSITWDGLDDFGDPIGRGVYVYRLKVRADNFSVAEKYEKLVILR